MDDGESMATEAQSSRYLALDVGGTRIKAGVVTAAGEVLVANAVGSHPGGSRRQVLADIDLALEPFRGEQVTGLGVGFPSFGDFDHGIIDSELSSYPSMSGLNLRKQLEEIYEVPVRVVSDANLFAFGILRFGEGRRFSSFMAIGLGTGPAIGLVQGGEVLNGPRGFPEPTMRFYTEWGWPDSWKHSGYHFAEYYGADAEVIYSRAVHGEREALNAFEQVGEALANTIARLAEETGIRTAVIGGGLANAWRFFESSLRHVVEPQRISVMRTQLESPSLLGAAVLFER